MKCRICNNKTTHIFNGVLLSFKVSYFECNNCQYVQTEFPYWLDLAYKDPINKSDTGIIVRNLSNIDVVFSVVKLLKLNNPIILDYAGGFGLLVRMLRDKGLNAYWSDRYCKNIVANGFEYRKGDIDLITGFECIEHFENPIYELNEMFKKSKNILLSTELIKHPAPSQKDWWYYGQEHGQHIGFFRVRTFEYIAKEKNKFYTNLGPYHLLSENPCSKLLWKSLLKIVKLKIIKKIIYKKSKTWQDHLDNSF